MNLKELKLFSEAPNIAEHLNEDTLQKIGTRCYEQYKQDKISRNDWEKTIEKAIKLAKQVLEEKSFPWPNCANTNYPLVTVGAIQFNARAYPAIINSNLVVKGEVIGSDKSGDKTDRAERIGKHMSYQYLYEQEEWETDTDRLLLSLPIMGDMFRKSYYNSTLGRNCSKLVYPINLVYDYDTPFEKVNFKTEEFELYPNQTEEKMRNGIYLDVDLNISKDEIDKEDLQMFLEHHCLLDLDDDGYKEPYIVTVHKKSQKVVRIVARFDYEDIIVRLNDKTWKVKDFGETDLSEAKILTIPPVEYYTQYYFIPSPDGKGYNLGLGELLENISAQINTTLNQLIDAGTLANQQGGFVAKGLRIKKGKIEPSLNEFTTIETISGMSLRENIVPFDFKGPSLVLFNLLGFLVDAARDISSVKDIMTGESAGANESPTVYVSRINEGLKVFSAIFKRIHMSLKKEFKKQFRLNRIYMEPQKYFRILDNELAVAKSDYDEESIDVIPVSDPTMATMAQKVAVTRALNEMYTGNPRINQGWLVERTLESMDVSGTDKAIVPEDQLPQPPPDPKLIEAESKMMLVKPQVDESQAKIQKTAEEVKEIQVRTANLIEEVEKMRETAEITKAQEIEKLRGLELDNQQKAIDLRKTDEEIRKIIQEILDMKEDDGRSETS